MRNGQNGEIHQYVCPHQPWYLINNCQQSITFLLPSILQLVGVNMSSKSSKCSISTDLENIKTVLYCFSRHPFNWFNFFYMHTLHMVLNRVHVQDHHTWISLAKAMSIMLLNESLTSVRISWIASLMDFKKNSSSVWRHLRVKAAI